MTTPKAASTDKYGERVYLIPRRGETDPVERPGITRVMKVLAAPALETWKMKKVAEAALAHTVANRVEAAYRRTDFLDKRKVLMRDWADFVMSGSE